ncbi:MAG: hypothetical protein NVSMB65_21400 [Chloroflexota bacterium]
MIALGVSVPKGRVRWQTCGARSGPLAGQAVQGKPAASSLHPVVAITHVGFDPAAFAPAHLR